MFKPKRFRGVASDAGSGDLPRSIVHAAPLGSTGNSVGLGAAVPARIDERLVHHGAVAGTRRRRFAISLPLATGEYEFKLASQDWTAIDLGVAGDTPVIDENAEAQPLAPKGANIRLKVQRAGVYRFTVNEVPGGEPRLTVRLLPN